MQRRKLRRMRIPASPEPRAPARPAVTPGPGRRRPPRPELRCQCREDRGRNGGGTATTRRRDVRAEAASAASRPRRDRRRPGCHAARPVAGGRDGRSALPPSPAPARPGHAVTCHPGRTAPALPGYRLPTAPGRQSRGRQPFSYACGRRPGHWPKIGRRGLLLFGRTGSQGRLDSRSRRQVLVVRQSEYPASLTTRG